MAELQINLPDSMSQYADAQIASGRFPTIHDYVGALVAADEQAQHAIAQLSENSQLAALLEEGLESPAGRRWSAAVLQDLKEQVLKPSSGNRA
jgi:putative addiction module CopG family antidote